MSAINISEKRRPQGGRITFTMGQSDLDIRVSTLPTLYGESISLRLLNEKVPTPFHAGAWASDSG